MNTPTLGRLLGRLLILAWLASGLALTPQAAQAQIAEGPAPEEKFSRQELAQLLAPIALYPDPLLSQILMASTYPIEVIEADRWLKKNPGLTGDPLDRALQGQDWDPSVKALCHVSTVLAKMSERIAETTNLGNAFLAQEDEVLDMVQELRSKAYAEGHLTSTAQQKVAVENEAISIEPTDPQVIYVPYYDPFYIYGPWWYPAYPPYYWGPAGVRLGIGISFWPGIYFGFSFGNWCYFDWHHHQVYVNAHHAPPYVRHGHWSREPGYWQHAPDHRRGVAYRDKFTARKYGQAIHRPSDLWRDNRGFPERRDVQRDRERAPDQRTVADHGQRGADKPVSDRYRQERQRIEGQLKARGEQGPGHNELDRQGAAVVGNDRQGRDRGEPLQPERPGVGREPQGSPGGEAQRQYRQRSDQEGRTRERAVREQQQRSRDNIFNPVDDGRRERKASERGSFSRQERGGEFRDRARPGGDGHKEMGRPGRGGH